MFLKLSSPKLPIQKPTPNYLEHSLFSVMSAEELLRNVRWQAVLNEIRHTITLPEHHYQSLYQDLMANFAAFVQVLPINPGGYLGTILDEGLHRALFAVQMYLDAATPDDLDPLFAYAIFSAALLVDVRKVLANKKVMISEEDGTFISEWQPFAGPLAPNSFYKIRNFSQPMSRLSPYLTTVLALKIMPEKGYLWLCQDYSLLNMWLSALNGDIENAGGIGHFLDLAKIRLRQLREKNVKPIIIKTQDPVNTALGEEFLAWLKKHATAENVVVTEEGILLEDKIFQDFAEVRKSINWVKVREEFNHMGLTKLSWADKKFEQAFSDAPDAKNAKVNANDKKNLGSFFNQLANQIVTAAKQRIIKTGLVISSNWLPITRKLQQTTFQSTDKPTKAEARIAALDKVIAVAPVKAAVRSNVVNRR